MLELLQSGNLTWLLNLATLGLLYTVFRYIEKLRKLPDSPLPRAEYDADRESDAKAQAARDSENAVLRARVSSMWHALGMSSPRQERASVPNEEPDPFPSDRPSPQKPPRYRALVGHHDPSFPPPHPATTRTRTWPGKPIRREDVEDAARKVRDAERGEDSDDDGER